jgi:hypothetical protein
VFAYGIAIMLRHTTAIEEKYGTPLYIHGKIISRSLSHSPLGSYEVLSVIQCCCCFLFLLLGGLKNDYPISHHRMKLLNAGSFVFSAEKWVQVV